VCCVWCLTGLALSVASRNCSQPNHQTRSSAGRQSSVAAPRTGIARAPIRNPHPLTRRTPTTRISPPYSTVSAPPHSHSTVSTNPPCCRAPPPRCHAPPQRCHVVRYTRQVACLLQEGENATCTMYERHESHDEYPYMYMYRDGALMQTEHSDALGRVQIAPGGGRGANENIRVTRA
jgi:hypothetical protein